MLVGNINSDIDDAAIIGVMIAMTHRLKLTLVAEGVETEAQFEYLREKGCNAIQWHLYGAAVTAVELMVLL